jgi:hypothetical protein
VKNKKIMEINGKAINRRCPRFVPGSKITIKNREKRNPLVKGFADNFI